MNSPAGITIRLARASDLRAINDIYNHYVRHSTCTYQLEPETMAARQPWFTERSTKHPVTVAELDARLVGWAALSAFRDRAGYAGTVENTVYVHHEFHGRGIGRMLLTDLIARATECGYHTIIAGASAEQTASIQLHLALGYVQVAHFREVGRKFSQWLDVVFLQRMLP